MHELAIALKLVEIARASAKRAQAPRVGRVRLKVGELGGVALHARAFTREAAPSLSPSRRQVVLEA